MKADLTRRTHVPERHYSRTIHQQGRVPLDADLNEQFDIDAHVDRTQTVDVIGRTGAPKGSSFALTVLPSGTDVRIAPGHYYVDGILCELDGGALPIAGIPATGRVQLERLVADARPLAVGQWVEIWSSSSDSQWFPITAVDPVNRTLDVTGDVKTPFGGKTAQLRRATTYVTQPDLPRPPGVASSGPARFAAAKPGQYLAYLDVWEHHVTALEDANIRESALNGADTCTRAKTIWQVKLDWIGAPAAAVDCATPVPGSTDARGALAARANLASTDGTPCVIAPDRKYRRLENQLYRVEIHDGGKFSATGASDPVTFKYSRDNGSVVAAWVKPAAGDTAAQIRVDSLGRDAVLGLAANQWVELIDDTRELAGQPGTLAKIKSISGKVLTLTAATGSTAFADFPSAPRVRRWDQVSATATLAVARPGTNDGYLALEDGVEVRFSDGRYDTGDYWMIPARALLTDVEWPVDAGKQPLAMPRHGIEHHYAPLGIFAWDGTKLTPGSDCRAQFPPLNHICADDICLHDDPCGKGWKTVQDAVSELCQERDLAFHNQHLHGFGVVCGMQVNCLTTDQAAKLALPNPREYVWLKPGYAIDPTGADINVKDQPVPIADLMVKAGIATRVNGAMPDVSASLWIDNQGLHVDPYDPNAKFDWVKFLDGTLLMDFYHECIENVINLIKTQINPGPNEGLVGPTTKRLISFFNLLFELNQPYGANVFVSGEKDVNADLGKEDYYLRSAFLALKALLQSDTFCAMFDDIDFPAYDLYQAALPANAPHPSTIFGKGFHHRLRLHPDGKYGFTMGNGSTINVYDLANEKIVQEVQFPVAPSEVQDVAFDPTGNFIYAIAIIGDQKADSVFAVGTLAADRTVSWNVSSQVHCDQLLITLGTSANNPATVYAAARGANAGVFAFNPLALNPTPPSVGAAFNSTGHLVVSDRQKETVLYAGEDTTGKSLVNYNQVRRIDLANTGQPGTYSLGQNTGNDELAVGIDVNNKTRQLFVPISPVGGDNAGVLTFDADNTGVAAKRNLFADTSSHAHLAYNPKTQFVFCALEDTYRGVQLNAQTNVLSTEIHPLHIGPCSVAVSIDLTKYYVLNYVSNTIISIPASYGSESFTADKSAIDLVKLADYRAKAMTAFVKMLGRFAQYLKDCFCDHLLIKCPNPAGKKVYLADVAFKAGVVHQICNFSVRRYVHTFPTVEYWMSLIPVLPFVKKAIADFCCKELAGVFDKFTIPQKTVVSGAKASQARMGVQWYKSTNIKGLVGAHVGKLFTLGGTGKAMALEGLSAPPSGARRVALSHDQILNQPAASATQAAQRQGVTIGEIKKIDGATAAGALARGAFAPTSLSQGEKIDLFVNENNQVVSFAPSPPDAAGVAELRATVEQQKVAVASATAVGGQVTALDTKVADLQTQLARRDERIGQLGTDLSTLQTRYNAREQDFQTLNQTVNEMNTRHELLRTQLADLSKQITITKR